MISRATVMRSACPTCNAGPGVNCVNPRGKARFALHVDRWIAAREPQLTTRELLEAAATLLLFPDAWAQYGLAYDARGFDVNPFGDEAECWDATAAIAVIAGMPNANSPEVNAAYDLLEDYLGQNIDKFNDAFPQSAEVVASALLETADQMYRLTGIQP